MEILPDFLWAQNATSLQNNLPIMSTTFSVDDGLRSVAEDGFYSIADLRMGSIDISQAGSLRSESGWKIFESYMFADSVGQNRGSGETLANS